MSKCIMHKMLLLISVMILASIIMCACNVKDNPLGSNTNDPENSATQEPTSKPNDKDSESVTDESDTATESLSGSDSESEKPIGPIEATVPETLKILAIGNSFSVDAMEFLYDIAKDAGVKNIVLGNMHIGGCSLETHLQHAQNNDGAYTYYKNTTGTWTSTKDRKFLDCLKDEEWDYISMQQTSKTSGLAASYGKTLTSLIDIVETNAPKTDAKLLWHMTWAYQQDSTHSSFPLYGKDQMKMYNMIVDVMKNTIEKCGKFDMIIPCGTTIQNVRTSFVGDTITRDGYHMNYTLGRYLLGLTWFAKITGLDISDIEFAPAGITAELSEVAKESVMNAIKSPYKITESKHKEGYWAPNSGYDSTKVVDAADCFENDKALAATVGVNLDNYVILEYEYLENSYYYCTKGTGITVPAATAGTHNQNICTKKIFSKAEIPENAVIICDNGWQFRPEKWISLDKKASSRPAMCGSPITLLDSAWWGSDNYLAWNISSSPKTDISEYYAAAASHVRIYIPAK